MTAIAVTLDTLANLDNGNSAVQTINTNFGDLEAAVESAVAKSGDTMTGTLNMNGNRITGLPEPTADTDPARLGDIQDAIDLADQSDLSLKYKARGYRNAALNSPNNTTAAVALDTEDFDTGGIFDPTTGRFTPVVAGYYLVSGRVRTNTTGTICVHLFKNGAFEQGLGSEVASSSASQGTTLIHCNGTSDYLELAAFTSSVRAYSVGNDFDVWMSVLGPF